MPRTLNEKYGLSGFFHTDDGALAIGQPDVAATWYPVNDHPSDPATYTVAVTVPEGLAAISNGVLEEQTGSTFTWRSAEPMPSYLVGLAIGPFDVRAYEAGGLRFWDAVDPDLPELAVVNASLARQPEMIDFLSGVFGPYPFTEAGGIVDDLPELQFALENQTRPIYSPASFSDATSGDVVVVHELAHQWFGDSLHLTRWQDIWLNEGFATYAEWLWDEREGRGTVAQRFEAKTTSRPAGRPVLDGADRRSRSSRALRPGRLRPRRDDRACPAHGDRRRGVRPAGAGVDRAGGPRRHDGGVRRARGGGVRSAARRAVHDLAGHAAQAGLSRELGAEQRTGRAGRSGRLIRNAQAVYPKARRVPPPRATSRAPGPTSRTSGQSCAPTGRST